MRSIEGEIGGYLLDEVLGEGGSATVYRAHRPPDDTPVAVKILGTAHRDDDAVERLHREFGFAGRFDHPHIVTMFESGPYWLAMRYLGGGNVLRLRTAPQRLAAVAQIAGALDAVHRGGVVHCDVKPSNILVHQSFSEHGAVLTDFGIAHSMAADVGRRLAREPGALSLDPARRITHRRDTAESEVQVSLPYAAPEMLLGRMPSAASDQYALACTAVELFTGAPPFIADTPYELTYAQVHQPPPRLSDRDPGLPATFDATITRALDKDPERRFPSCAALSDALHEAWRGRR